MPNFMVLAIINGCSYYLPYLHPPSPLTSLFCLFQSINFQPYQSTASLESLLCFLVCPCDSRNFRYRGHEQVLRQRGDYWGQSVRQRQGGQQEGTVVEIFAPCTTVHTYLVMQKLSGIQVECRIQQRDSSLAVDTFYHVGTIVDFN